MYWNNYWPVDPAGIEEQLQVEFDLIIAGEKKVRREAEIAAMNRSQRYKANNRGRNRHDQALRRTSELDALPPWLSKDQMAQIFEKYELAAAIQQATGIEFDVHHIVPLVGKCSEARRHIVCGLHVPWNLKIVEKKRNLELGDSFECDLPCCADCRCGNGQSENGDINSSAPF